MSTLQFLMAWSNVHYINKTILVQIKFSIKCLHCHISGPVWSIGIWRKLFGSFGNKAEPGLRIRVITFIYSHITDLHVLLIIEGRGVLVITLGTCSCLLLLTYHRLAISLPDQYLKLTRSVPEDDQISTRSLPDIYQSSTRFYQISTRN